MTNNKYFKQLPTGATVIDVYDVISIFSVNKPGLQQALKKILFPGSRGNKSCKQDLEEAIQAIQRQIELDDLYV